MQDEAFTIRRDKLSTLLGWDEDTTSDDRIYDLAEVVVRVAPSAIVREIGARCSECRGRTGFVVDGEWELCSRCGGTGLNV